MHGKATEQQSDVVPCSRMRLDAARAMRVGLQSIALGADARCIACARTTINHTETNFDCLSDRDNE
jgi:hypothetical protein